MDIVNVMISKIKPYERNAKKHPDEQVEQIANSIKEFGFQQPLVLDKDNVIIIGHGRWLAAKKLDLVDVPCVYADELSEEQIKALRLADNKLNESAWDFELLDSELEELIDIDMSRFGFDINQELPILSEKRNEVNYNETISVVIDCENDDEAENIYNQLKKEGYNCRISTL